MNGMVAAGEFGDADRDERDGPPRRDHNHAKIHELFTAWEHFDPMWCEKTSSNVRPHLFDFVLGDLVMFRELVASYTGRPGEVKSSGRWLLGRLTYVGEQIGGDLVLLSFEELGRGLGRTKHTRGAIEIR